MMKLTRLKTMGWGLPRQALLKEQKRSAVWLNSYEENPEEQQESIDSWSVFNSAEGETSSQGATGNHALMPFIR